MDYSRSHSRQGTSRTPASLYDYDDFVQPPSTTYAASRPGTQYRILNDDDNYLGGRNISSNGVPYDIISFDDQPYDDFEDDRAPTSYQYEPYEYERPDTVAQVNNTQYRDHVPSYMETTNNAEYGWKVPLAQQRHKVESGLPSNIPFYGDTTNRDHYGPKIPLAPKKIEKPAQDLAKVPFYAETTSRATYTPKAMVPRKNMKPEGTLGNQKVQGDYDTTHNMHYVPMQAQRARAIRRASSLFPGGQGRYATEISDNFTQKKDHTCPAIKYMSSAPE